MEIKRDGFTVLLEEPALYVDNKSRHRSGHMSHAMAEFGEVNLLISIQTALLSGGTVILPTVG